jgi:Rieske 2Fe-2S family protein
MTSFVRTTSTYQQGATTLPRDYYNSAAILEEETERLFWNAWLCVGRAERLAEPGSYLLHERFGESVIVVHARSGEIRAFYNMCRHRGTKICEAVTGQFSSFNVGLRKENRVVFSFRLNGIGSFGTEQIGQR